MKKAIKKLILLIFILVIISNLTILLLGKTYTVTFSLSKNYTKLKVKQSTEDGEVEIIKEKKDADNYYVKVKSKKPGKTFIIMDYGEFKESKILYIHKSMIITDNNIFGKCTGSEIIALSSLILLIYIISILFKKYKKESKENIYQYKNIAYIGIIIFLSFFALNTFISIFNYQGLYATIRAVIYSASVLSFFLFPIAFITFILVTISNLILIKKEGISPKNLLGLFLGIFICLATLFPDFLYRALFTSNLVNISNLNAPGPYIYAFVETFIYMGIAYLECVLIGTMIMGIKSAKNEPKYNKDYIIILGSQIRKDGSLTPLLQGRVDRALDFRKNQLDKTGKDLKFIPSGGKGNDEVISESEAIKEYLLEKGIKAKDIIVENKSKNTYENIKFSTNLIKDKKANICFSTTNYHVLRAGLIATSQNLKLEGIGSKTKSYFWINAFIREFVGTLYSERKKHIIMFSLTLIITIIMIWILYIANNM